MKRIFPILAVVLCLAVGVDGYASDYGRIAIFADEDHSISEVWHSAELSQFNIYIFCLPSDNGLMCTEFSVEYPGNVITSVVTGNSGLSIALGDLDSGMSACFVECQNDWIWTHTQTLYLMDAAPATIEIAAHSEVGVYQFSNCEPGFPLEQIFYANPLYLNSSFSNDTDPPVVLSAESIDQNHVVVQFDEPLFAETALSDGDFEIFEKEAPGNLVDLIPSALSDEDRTITLVATDTLVHGLMYTLRIGNVMDCRGNVMPETLADFEGLDTYPPEYTVCEIDPDRLGVTVCFSEPVHPYSASRPGSYWFYEDPYAHVDFGVVEANLQPDGQTVQLAFDKKFKAGQSYRLWVRFVRDLAENQVRDDAQAFFMVPDTYPPEIIEIRGVAGDVLSVRFDEELEVTTATDPDNYEVLVGGDPSDIVLVTHVTTDISSDWLYLFLARSIETGVNHVLKYISICDLIGNCIGSGGGPALTCGFLIDSDVGTLLEQYSAEYSGVGIEIRWHLSTATEENSFIMLRAEKDNTFFETIESPVIECNGTDYRFVDKRIEPASNYRYRVEYLLEGSRKLLFETEPIYTPKAAFSLYQNRPNPFNPTTEIAYSLPVDAHVTLEIFDVSGRRINCLIDRFVKAGINRIVWNGLDDGNRPVASGIYFYRLVADDFVQTKKMVLLR